MQPQRKIEAEVFRVPKFEMLKQDVTEFVEELKGFHGEFGDCFHRSELREHFSGYMVGRFSKLERKTIEPIAHHVKGGNLRQMQYFISDAVWNEERMLKRYHEMVVEDMGDERGVLIFDETGFPKKGKKSAGVAKQYCGATGKVDNCQVGVFCSYATPSGYALLDKRLFLPEDWFSQEYQERRQECLIPQELEFVTKPQLAARMFEEIARNKEVPFKYVTADTVYGNSPDFIEAIETDGRAVYFLAVSGSTQCVLKRPLVVEKEYRYRGKKRVKKVVKKWNDKPVRIDRLAKNINSYFWYRRTVSEGTKGPITYEFTRRQVTLCRDNLPDKTVWIIIKRTIDKDPTYSYYISNAPASTRLNLFVWLSGVRWAIEQCFEETKTEVGMDHYEVRKYPGWHHHILCCILAHFFLWHLRIKLGEKSTGYYAVAA